jgi:hypothetical protein
MHNETGRADTGEQAGSAVAAEAVQEEPLASVPLSPAHRTGDWACNPACLRVNSFFREDGPRLVQANYCRVFVLPNPNDPTEIWGFYTLSPSGIARKHATGSDQKRLPGGLPIPLVLIGFMGRHLQSLPALEKQSSLMPRVELVAIQISRQLD